MLKLKRAIGVVLFALFSVAFACSVSATSVQREERVFYYFEKNDFADAKWTGTKDFDNDGNLIVAAGAGVNNTVSMKSGSGSDYVFEAKIKVDSFGRYPVISVMSGSHRFQIYMYNTRFGYRDSGGSTISYNYNVGYDYHVWKYVVKGANATLYIDGNEVISHGLQENTAQPEVRLYAEGSASESCQITIEYIKVSGPMVPEADMGSYAYNSETEGFDALTTSTDGGMSINQDGNLVVVGQNGWTDVRIDSMPLGSDYIFSSRLRITKYGHDSHGANFLIRQGDGRVQVYIGENSIKYRSSNGNTYEVSYSIGSDWHVFDVLSCGQNAYIYIDGNLVVITRKEGSYGGRLAFGANSNGTNSTIMEVDYANIRIPNAGAYEITRNNLKYGVKDASSLLGCETISTDYSVNNYSNQDINYVIVLALYDETKRMVSVEAVEGVIARRSSGTLEIAEMTLPPVVDGYTLKAFVWDGLSTLKPFGSEKII